jgi:16S rRNA A1518/A1519 N6-dimethyltransferase RsmA/KsgA/DIM1 with predicted DNA glycosylase/AP lyase activity
MVKILSILFTILPYIYYRKMIQEYVYESANVLEIGAGMGENTEFLLATK